MAEAEREDRLAQLEGEVERKTDRVADLEAEVDRLREARPAGEADPEEVQQLRDDVDRVRTERDEARERADAIEADLAAEAERREALAAEVADLQNARDALAQVREDLQAALVTAGGDLEDPATDEAAAERIDDLEAEVAALEAENERLRSAEAGDIVTIPSDYQDFYEHATVEEAIAGAVDDARSKGAGEKAVWGVVLSIADVGGPVDYDEIADRLGYKDNTSVGKAATALESRGVVKEVDTRPKRIDFAFDNMAEIERKHKIREEMDRRIEQRLG